jgi:hypothetical protein
VAVFEAAGATARDLNSRKRSGKRLARHASILNGVGCGAGTLARQADGNSVKISAKNFQTAQHMQRNGTDLAAARADRSVRATSQMETACSRRRA